MRQRQISSLPPTFKITISMYNYFSSPYPFHFTCPLSPIGTLIEENVETEIDKKKTVKLSCNPITKQ